MSKKKSDAFAQFVVGLFMLAVLALLGYFTIVVSGVDILSGKARVKLTVTFDQVGGLKEHDSVMYRGTKVGTVERVVVTPTNLVVTADVDENVVLRSGYSVTVRNLSMLGGNYLALEEGLGDRLDLAHGALKGTTPTDWMQDVSKIARALNEAMNKPELYAIVTNVLAVSEKSRRIADRIDVVSDRIARGEGLVGKLVSSDTRLYHDIESAVSNVNVVVARVSRGEGLAGHVLSDDDRLYNELRESVGAFRSACTKFDTACTKFDIGDVKRDFSTLATNGNRLVENLNAVAVRLKNGEGTLGRLNNDPALYMQIEALIKDCRQIIDNYRDTTPIATFSSVLSGAL